jgi:hypothetical protein
MQLSSHFSRAEIERSQKACELGIANTIPIGQLETWRAGAVVLLETIRTAVSNELGLDVPIQVRSGYRCEELNKTVRGRSVSMHRGIWMVHDSYAKLPGAPAEGSLINCCAFDLQIHEKFGGQRKFWQIIYPLVKERAIPVFQLIWEFTDTLGNPRWLHVAYVDPSDFPTPYLTSRTHDGLSYIPV